MWFARSRSDGVFKARSSSRDAETDSGAIKAIADAIDSALAQAESERIGLKKRIDDVISRAAFVGGNDADEFLTRSHDRTEMLRSADADIKRGQERLEKIEKNITDFQFLKMMLLSRFPDSQV